MVKATWNGKVLAESDQTIVVEGNHYFPPESLRAEWFEDAKFFLTHYPNVPHDDDIDALFICIENLLTIMHPATIARRDKWQFQMR